MVTVQPASELRNRLFSICQIAIRNRHRVVLAHHALGLHREHPVQVRPRRPPERRSFLGRRHRKLLVELGYVALAQKPLAPSIV